MNDNPIPQEGQFYFRVYNGDQPIYFELIRSSNVAVVVTRARKAIRYLYRTFPEGQWRITYENKRLAWESTKDDPSGHIIQREDA